MADEPSTSPQARSMSLVPYSQDLRQIVLRRGNAVVEYDADSHEITLRDTSDQPLELTECPMCHQPLPGGREASAGDANSSRPPDGDRPFMNPNYFAMLAASQRPSPASSGSGTPVRRIIPQALRSGRSRDVSGSGPPPPPDNEGVNNEPAPSAGRGFSDEAFNQGFFRRNFREKRELGRGGNGVVLLVEHVIQDTSLGHFACKRIPVGNSLEYFKKLIVEVRLLQNIPHANIVTPHWVWLEDYQSSHFGPSIPYLWILLDYCNGGDLHGHVLGPSSAPATAEKLKERLRRRSKGDMSPAQDLRGPSKLTFEEIFSFFRDITSGLHHLHSKGYIHRDLKPSNCLLHHEGGRTRVLISDFGEVQSAEAVRGSTGATGTVSFCAPEVLQRTTDGSFGNFTTKSDIFSLGMIVYFMCFGRLPYSNADDINEESEDLDELRAEITKWPGFNEEARARPDLPEQLYRYLKRLLSVDPNDRPGAGEILASIKGGAGQGDLDWAYEDTNLRVSSVDASSPKTTNRSLSKPPAIYPRPARAAPNRHRSSDNHARPKSPTKRDHSRGSPQDGQLSVALSQRKIEPIATAMGPQPLSPQSPRLMLPPPPARPAVGNEHRLLDPRSSVFGVRTALFLVKLVTLSAPCTPYAANGWIMYSLLGFAALDLGLLGFSYRQSLLMFGIHVATVILAQRYGQLCEAARLIVREESR